MDRFASTMARALCVIAVVTLHQAAARAATTGNLQGRVTDAETQRPLAGVTVIATGPQGDQTEFSDASGRFMITDLAPGEYVVRFYFANVKVERPGVLVQADKTLFIDAPIPTARAKEQRYVIKEHAPTVDVATTQVQTQVTDELVKNTPVGRTYSSVLTLAPGSATDAVGFSFNGATGPENNFLINGMNTTSPAFGLLGTNLPLEFIAETEIITGGYNAEFGRATGGIVNVITKSGTNDFHGGAWFFYKPFTLDYPRFARPGEAIARQPHFDHAFDFGFDLGGPIVKDRVWFYGGFNPSFTTTSVDRILRRRTADHVDPKMMGDYLGDPDTSITCPPWLKNQSDTLCAPATAAAYGTTDIDSRLWRHYECSTRVYNLIGKLDLRISDDHSADITYIGGVSSFDGVSGTNANGDLLVPSLNGNPATGAYGYSNPSQTHDLVGHYLGKLLERRLQVDVRVGWHYEESEIIPSAIGASAGSNIDTRALTIQVFEDDLEPCKLQKLGDKGNINFNPCPVTSYHDQGFGFQSHVIDQRLMAAASGTYFLKLVGAHAIKLGGDFEYNWYQHRRFYTGTGAYTTFDGGGGAALVERQQFGQVDPNDPTRVIVFDGQGGRPLGLTATTTTYNESLYLRDSWNVGFLPGLTVNLGLRWEAQQAKDVKGETQIGIYDNWAPRLGFAYDILGKGRSKLYASYGRFYESIPLDINDRQFSGEGLVIQDLAPGDPKNSCQTDANGRVSDFSTCHYPSPIRSELNGGTYGIVAPLIQGQYSNEVVVGAQAEVGLDIVLGAAYIHRDLGRIIEDLSPDGGRTYIIGNPGEAPDSGTVERLQSEVNALNRQIQGTADPAALTALRKKRDDTSQQIALYKAAGGFEKPKRDYNALVLTASKRLSHNFILLASYTYSRTIGNYPGLFQASNGQLDPNISTQYDLPELLINRNGPLPNDRPHNLKVIGSYLVPLGAAGRLTLGLNFTAQSGTPIEVLGRHPTYGANESFILPRGSGGRTPTLTQFDLRVAYAKTITRAIRAELSLDIFNVFNQQEVAAVDPQYTTDRVLPIQNGSYENLKTLKTTSGGVPHLNPNYGQPTGYQAPLSLRLGARISF